MSMSMPGSRGLLLIQSNTAVRKTLRAELGRAGYAVLAVNSMGEATARLRMRTYHLVVCSDQQRSVSWADDYELLIDRRKLLSRSGGRFELYLPSAGMGTDGVLIMPCNDPATLRSAVDEASGLLEQMRTAGNDRKSGPTRALSA